MSDRDVTALVEFGNNDDEFLPMLKCVCGAKYTLWDWSISIYREIEEGCPSCGRKLYFRNAIRVYEVSNDR